MTESTYDTLKKLKGPVSSLVKKLLHDFSKAYNETKEDTLQMLYHERFTLSRTICKKGIDVISLSNGQLISNDPTEYIISEIIYNSPGWRDQETNIKEEIRRLEDLGLMINYKSQIFNEKINNNMREIN